LTSRRRRCHRRRQGAERIIQVHGKNTFNLKAHLGDDGTFGLIEMLESEQKNWSQSVLITATDRFERRLTQEVGLLRQDVQKSLQDGLGGIRSDLANARVEMLRCSFAFWIGQVATIAALLAFMLRAAGH
jgi:hypothetical protein